MNQKLGLTRNIIKRNYALITPDGHVPGVLPGWSHCKPFVLISSALGAGFSQYLVNLNENSIGLGNTGAREWFLYVVAGSTRINSVSVGEGGFAFLPPGSRYDVRGAAKDSRLLIFEKTYEPLSGQASPEFFTGIESDIAESPFLGDPHARLKILIPDSPATDMAVNVFTYDPGATLPFVETHVMEHGMLFLSGRGVYRLDNDWHPVNAGDVIWIAPYCPQWFIAGGPEPTRYIYYKDVNRMPP